jgi:hypothetical protein
MFRSCGLLVVVLLAASCAASDTDSGECADGRCDDFTGGSEDPIAHWLRIAREQGVLDSKLVLHLDRLDELDVALPEVTGEATLYGKLLAGVAALQGCPPDSIVNYAISDELITRLVHRPFPRLVSTVCADRDEVADFFMATLGRPDASGDIELRDLELFAWDRQARRYRFYATNHLGGNRVEVEIEPARCQQCHRTPLDTDPVGMPMLPIMNELTKPWPHWDPGLGGVAESFHVPASLADRPNWRRFGVELVGAASRLESVIRRAMVTRIGPARAIDLRQPYQTEAAMGLLRPLFCDEQVNFASEINTGLAPPDLLVDGGIRAMFAELQQSPWPWGWFNDDFVALAPTTPDRRIFMAPVRGVAEVGFEQLLTRGSRPVLTPTQVLQVKALDWHAPVLSRFRCGLWKDALERFGLEPPDVGGSERNRDAIPILFDLIMQIDGLPLSGREGELLSLERATDAAVRDLAEALRSGKFPRGCDASGFCAVDLPTFGGMIDAHVRRLGTPAARDELLAERRWRVCHALERVVGAGDHARFSGGERISSTPSYLRLLDGDFLDTAADCN